jgi:hypothetical protein
LGFVFSKRSYFDRNVGTLKVALETAYTFLLIWIVVYINIHGTNFVADAALWLLAVHSFDLEIHEGKPVEYGVNCTDRADYPAEESLNEY